MGPPPPAYLCDMGPSFDGSYVACYVNRLRNPFTSYRSLNLSIYFFYSIFPVC